MKRKVKLTAHFGMLVGCEKSKEMEFDFDGEATEEEMKAEVDEYAEEWALQELEWGWEFVD